MLLAAGFLLASLSAVPAGAAESWSDLHGTLSASGAGPVGTRFQPGAALVPPLSLQWSFRAPGGSSPILDSSPALDGGLVYFGGYDGSAYYCLNAQDGAMVWSASTAAGAGCPGRVRVSPALGLWSGAPALFGGSAGPAGCGTDAAQVVDTATGSLMNFPVGAGGFYSTGPTIAGSVVYSAASDGTLYARNTSSGSLAWSYLLGGSVVGSVPSVDSGIVFVSTDQGVLTAVSAGTGSALWSFGTPVPVTGAARQTASGGLLFGGLDDRKLYAWAVGSGAVAWSYATGITSSVPAVAYGLVYAGDWSGTVRALNAANGTLAWSWNAGAAVRSSIAVSNGFAYVATADHRIVALNAALGGTPVWSFSLPPGSGAGFGWSAPAIADGRLLVTDNESGAVLAFVPTAAYTFVPSSVPTGTVTATATMTATATVTMSSSETLTISTTPSESGTVTPTLTPTALAGDRFSLAMDPLGPLYKTSDFPVRIRFALHYGGMAGLAVYTSSGERVAMLFEGRLGVADTRDKWWDGRAENGRALASGVYVVRIFGPGYQRLTKIAILRDR